MQTRRERSKHHNAFQVWYTAGRNFEKASQNLADIGEYTSSNTLNVWSHWFNWHDRADKLDKEAQRRADNDAIRRKADMLKRHAATGRTLQGVGVTFIRDTGLQTGQQAINAITKGVELERMGEGLPAWVLDMMGMSDDELLTEYRHLYGLYGANPEASSDSIGIEETGDTPATTGRDTGDTETGD